jgi:hypothetical protein
MNNMTDIADELDVKLLLATLMALKKGDFTARMPSDWTGVSGKIADTLNDIIETKENGPCRHRRVARGRPRRPADAARGRCRAWSAAGPPSSVRSTP